MSRGLRNNNPGNIRHSSTRWQGEVAVTENSEGLDSDFKTFVSAAYGYRAMFKLLYNYSLLHNCKTLSAMIYRWAPPCENDSRAYVDAVARWSGLNPDEIVDVRDAREMMALVASMSRMENGVVAVGEDVERGWALFAREL